jgi:FMN phosphatase YigB (HAD superfamily)
VWDGRVGTFAAVVLDWRGTLVVPLTAPRWIELALERCGRDSSAPVVQDLLGRFRLVGDGADPFEGPDVDSSSARHREVYMDVFDAAGLDGELSEALYAVESDLSHDRFALDVAPTLTALRRDGIKVAVLSDIHVDVRPAFAAEGLAGLVDEFVLSFEHGIQKPHPTVFVRALQLLGTSAADTLMVGDRAHPDGGGVPLGITTLLLPPLRDVTDLRLHRVLDLCGVPHH